jgi:hypothetical protein
LHDFMSANVFGITVIPTQTNNVDHLYYNVVHFTTSNKPQDTSNVLEMLMAH